MIEIRPSSSADTRTADHLVTQEELMDSTLSHIDDVKKGMSYLAELMKVKGRAHDWTKVEFFSRFFSQFRRAQLSGEWGKSWYDEIHEPIERHHLEHGGPEDVDLLDVLEQIVDSVMAGKARSGRCEFKPLPEGILSKAYENTFYKMSNSVEVVEDDDAFLNNNN